MQKVSAEYADNDKSLEALTAKQKVCANQIEWQKEKVEVLKKALEDVKKQYSENSDEVTEWQKSLTIAETALIKSQRALDGVNDELDLQRRELASSENAVEEYDKSLGKVNDTALKFGDLVKANFVGDLLGDAFRSAANGVKEFIGEGIKLASDLREVQNVVDTTFGDEAGQIYKWADAAAESFGMSSLSAQRYSGTLGAMLKSQGIATQSIYEMSTSLVGLAGDMASFYNIDIQSAFEKIRSGLSGETEPLKQLGVNMNVANLEAHMLANGIDKSWNSMSVAEQTMVRYNYLMQQTADAQGDFVKTSDSFANQQRIAQLNMENLSAALGEKLLPKINEVTTTLNGKLPSLMDSIEDIADIAADMIGFIIDNHKAVIALTAGVGAFNVTMKGYTLWQTAATAINTLKAANEGATVSQIALNTAMNANPVGLIISGIVALVAVVGTLIAVNRSGEDSFDELYNSISETKSHIDELNGAYETNKARIEELNEIKSDGNITGQQKLELENLEAQNELLQIQIELEQKKLQAEKDAAEQTASGIISATAQTEGSLDNVTAALVEYSESVRQQKEEQELWAQRMKESYAVLSDESRKYTEKEKQFAQIRYDVALEAYNNTDLLTKAKIKKERENLEKSSQILSEMSNNLQGTTEESQKMQEDVAAVLQLVSEALYGVQEQVAATSESIASNLGMGNFYEGERIASEEYAKQQSEFYKEKAERYNTDLENYRSALDTRLKLHRINEEQYYENLRKYLEKHQNENSVVYYEMLDDVQDYYGKKADEQKRAEEQAQKEAEQAAKNAEQKQKAADKEALTSAKAKYDKLLDLYKNNNISKSEYDAEYIKLSEQYANVQTNLSKYAQEKMTEYSEEQAKERKKLLEDELTKTTNEYTKTLDDLQNKIDSFAGKLTNSFKDSLLWTTNADVFNEQVKSQEEAIKQLQNGLEECSELYGENSSEAADYQRKLTEAQKKLDELKENYDSSTGDKIISVKATDKMTEATNRMDEYLNVIDRLRERGIDNSMLQELSDMSLEEGMAVAEYWDSRTDEQLKGLSQHWEAYNQKSKELSQALYQNQIDEATDNYISSVTAKLNEHSPEMQEAGVKMVEALLAAYNPEMPQGAKSLQQLKSNMSSLLGGTIEISESKGEESGDSFIKKMSSSIESGTDALYKSMRSVLGRLQSELDKTPLTFQIIGKVIDSGAKNNQMSNNDYSAKPSGSINIYQYNTSPEPIDAASAYRHTRQALTLANTQR